MESTSPKFFCFVLMPFTQDFDDIYAYGIKESCHNAETYCERVDEQIFQERILDRIYNQIAKADLVIADMTGRNPNVFYEVGYAHALNKPTILLTQNADDIPFDLKHFPHIIYNNKISTIREELTKRILWFKENKSNESDYKTDIDIYVNNLNLLQNEVTYIFDTQQMPSIVFTVHNNSSKTYRLGEFQIGIVTKDFHKSNNPDVQVTKLPDNSYLHMLPQQVSLFPEAFTSYRNYFYNEFMHLDGDKTYELVIKIFTNAGSRAYPVRIRRKKTYTLEDLKNM